MKWGSTLGQWHQLVKATPCVIHTGVHRITLATPKTPIMSFMLTQTFTTRCTNVVASSTLPWPVSRSFFVSLVSWISKMTRSRLLGQTSWDVDPLQNIILSRVVNTNAMMVATSDCFLTEVLDLTQCRHHKWKSSNNHFPLWNTKSLNAVTRGQH
jgi:hypothetical protein